jgi:putative SOS response-associated peptidase YedK
MLQPGVLRLGRPGPHSLVFYPFHSNYSRNAEGVRVDRRFDRCNFTRFRSNFYLYMCGRFSLTTDPEQIRDSFELAEVPNLVPRYNVAPTQDVAVVVTVDGANELDLMRWGLIPSWSETADGPPLINARSETLFRKPSFKESIEKRRCIVPADGYYEWKKVPGYKQPHHIRMKDRGVFGMAAVWDLWRDSSDVVIQSCAIITTEANALSAAVHHRMPVILPKNSWSGWLSAETDRRVVTQLLTPFSDDLMEMEPVSPAVNRVATDSSECLRPAEVNFELDL